MSHIYMCGDPHGYFKHIVDAVLDAHAAGKCPDAIILLGDMDCAQQLEIELREIIGLTEVWFIPGNHDSDQNCSWTALTHSTLANRNLHGRVCPISGASVAGLGGVFRSSIWSPPNEQQFHSYSDWRKAFIKKIPPRLFGDHEFREERRHLTSIFPDTIQELSGNRADILATHEAPSCHKHGWKAVDELARSMKVKHVFHGHHHDRPDYSSDFASLGFQAHAVGFRGISAIDAEGNVSVIREGAYDAGGSLGEEQQDD